MTPQRTLVELSDQSMPGRERHLIGSWVCRAANGVTGRANSCTPTGDSGSVIDEAVTEVEGWFGDRGLRTLFQVWDGGDPAIIEVLDRRGYVTGEGAEVLTRPLGPMDWPAPSVAVELDDVSESEPGGEDLTPRLQELMMSPLSKVVASIPGPTSTPVSSGVGVLDGSAIGLFAMQTDPAWQRQGLGRSVLSTLLGAGAARNADLAWLQVTPSNAPAKALYEEFGFQRVHGYHYRAAPDARSRVQG